VVIDFIDMILESNREAVMRRLIECLGRDRTKHQVAEVTSLGLVQLTRKRIGQGLIEAFSTTCDSCNGRGIHIHTEPVRARAAEPVFAGHHDEHEVEAETSADAEADSESDSESDSNKESGSEKRGIKPRKRRRAVTTGVVRT
jgi:ribonuclease E